MSYHVQVTNTSDYLVLATFDGHTVAPNGGGWKSGTIGNGWITSEQFGTLAFLDLAKTRLGGDTAETWGVLITYQGEEIVGRYEGGGNLNVTVNEYGQAKLTGMSLRRVLLPPLIID